MYYIILHKYFKNDFVKLKYHTKLTGTFDLNPSVPHFSVYEMVILMLQPYRVIQIVYVTQMLHKDHKEISNSVFREKNHEVT